MIKGSDIDLAAIEQAVIDALAVQLAKKIGDARTNAERAIDDAKTELHQVYEELDSYVVASERTTEALKALAERVLTIDKLLGPFTSRIIFNDQDA